MISLAAVRRPEYTGENRCWPCTVANGVILLVCCLALAPVSIPIVLCMLIAGTSLIWLRGHLVPYTPQLTSFMWTSSSNRRPDRPLTGSLAEADEDDGERTLAALVEAGVIVPDGDRLRLDESFRDDWREEMRRLRGLSDESLTAEIETAARGRTVELLEADRPLFVLTGPDGGEAWVSRPVAIAETAAVAVLSTGLPTTSTTHSIAVARALRAFLDRCPVCETATEETSPHRCCGSVRNRSTLPESILVCPACDEALYRFPDA